jgi:hypothetical protein
MEEKGVEDPQVRLAMASSGAIGRTVIPSGATMRPSLLMFHPSITSDRFRLRKPIDLH